MCSGSDGGGFLDVAERGPTPDQISALIFACSWTFWLLNEQTTTTLVTNNITTSKVLSIMFTKSKTNVLQVVLRITNLFR